MSRVLFRGSNKSLEVRKIFCLGRNYAAHAKEMNSAVPESPVVFLKPATALIHDNGTVVLPGFSRKLHHEVEMVVVVGKGGRNIPLEEAYDFVEGYAVGLDMTLRDVQDEAKRKGLPWTVAKGFDTSAPLSPAVEKASISNPHALSITLKVNGKTKQESNTSRMIFKVDFVVSYLSSLFTLEAGDLIYTGTPEGVGEVHPGDVLEAQLESVGTLRVGISNETAH
jgi:2-keto-4-pentenoate hydratase/2-oxohepta-3-ene-1,7-dioic acid hydratase in catechol pathway